MANFTYVTDEKNIKTLKYLALELGVNARDVIDISLDIFEDIYIVNQNSDDLVTVSMYKEIIDNRINKLKNK